MLVTEVRSVVINGMHALIIVPVVESSITPSTRKPWDGKVYFWESIVNSKPGKTS